MATVYSYVRFSAKKQERGDSLRRQTQGALDYCTRHEHDLAELTLQDLGVSAFRGKHRHTGALKTFLNAIGDTVKPGSILLVENLDRLSREGISEALPLFLNILRKDVFIATLTPTERLYSKESVNDLVGILEPLLSFSLAHDESKKKSQRIKEHWNNRRANASNKPISRRCPSWCRWDEKHGKFKLIPKAAEAVRFIFSKTIDGLGQRRLLDELNQKFEPIGTSGKWNASYIQKILNDRSVLGEFQPKSFDEEGQRNSAGEMLVNYYPAVITEATWHRARASAETRQKHKSPSRDFVNLFSGLVFSAHDKTACYVQTTRSTRQSGKVYTQRRLISYAHNLKAAGAEPLSFDYFSFEKSMVAFLAEIKSADLEPTRVDHNSRLDEIEGEALRISTRLIELEKALAESNTAPARLLKAIADLEAQEAELKKESNKIKANRGADHLTESHDLLLAIEDPEKRLKLKSILPRLIDSIWVVLVPGEKRRVLAFVQVIFRGGYVRHLALDRDRAFFLHYGYNIPAELLGQGLPHQRLHDFRDLKVKKNYFPNLWSILETQQPNLQLS